MTDEQFCHLVLKGGEKMDNVLRLSFVCIETGKAYSSLSDASQDTGKSEIDILHNLKGFSKSVDDLHFEYSTKYQKAEYDIIPDNIASDIEYARDVKGYEGLYKVTKDGKVISSINNIVLRNSINKAGYYTVTLSNNGKTKKKFVHRLVAESFIPNPDNLPVINHKDENKLNNHVNNLEWCTHEYNLHYGTAIERRMGKLCKPIICIDTGELFCSIEAASMKFKISRQQISLCLRGKAKTAAGFHWKYL